MREIDNIVDFNSFKSAINKLDKMAQTDMTKPNTVFPQKNESVQDKFQRFFQIADGKPEWDV